MAKKEKRRIPAATEPPEKKKSPAAPSSGNPIADFFASKSVRETIESVAIAFILAFLFRTFEAEAFVIPTGSMAPTLMGQHKDLACPACGKQYSTGASESNLGRGQITGTTCPECRFINRFPPGDPEYPNYTGDRILVSKFIYDLQDPERWDVVVFKMPNNAKQNYIKRLIGKPHETLRIRHGNVYVRDENPQAPQADFVIARKPPDKIRATLQDVYDTHYLPKALVDAGWPERWQSPAAESEASAWELTGPEEKLGDSTVIHRGYSLAKPVAGQPQWLRYHHFAPRMQQWDDILHGRSPAAPPVQLITDFYSYNAPIQGGNWKTAGYDSEGDALGLHWVGDLAIDATVNIKGNEGKLLLDLVRAGRHFQCAINVADGKAELTIRGLNGAPESFMTDDGQQRAEVVTGQTNIRGPGKHVLLLANVDHQLTLWFDGKVIEFDGPTSFAPPENDVPQWTDTDDGDLAPAGIGSDGVAVDIERLKVLRDIYYIAVTYPTAGNPLTDYEYSLYDVNRVLRDPRGMYATERGTFQDVFASRRVVEFKLGADQFFAMGDNSPQSQDARIWDTGDRHYVDRKYLLGKALFIYWPHAVKFGPIPFIPNFKEMGFVR